VCANGLVKYLHQDVPDAPTSGTADLAAGRARPPRIDDGARRQPQRGYAATRVSDVLERTGISRRTFYAHFANREECFFAA
jgi:AcrR family transcriptional regulator